MRGNDSKTSVQIVFSAGERDIIQTWYRGHINHLPPGLAKRDRLPPGLEKQLRERGTLPPGLEKKIYPLPADLERQLPSPHSGVRRAIIGGNVVLISISTPIVQAILRLY